MSNNNLPEQGPNHVHLFDPLQLRAGSPTASRVTDQPGVVGVGADVDDEAGPVPVRRSAWAPYLASGAPAAVPASEPVRPVGRQGALLVAGVVTVWALVAGGIALGTEQGPVELTWPDKQAVTVPTLSSGDAAIGADKVAALRTQVFKLVSGSQTGTAFLIEKDLLLTSAHVVSSSISDGSVSVDVRTMDGASFSGSVAMADTNLDIALVRIPEQDAQPISLAPSASARPGDAVTLYGFPLGLGASVTTGVVSAVEQVTSLREKSAQTSLLQIDAAVNPGNSGGPVLNAAGEVLGVVAFRPDSVGTRPVQGVSFAVPSEDINVSLAHYRQHGNVRYGYLGVTLDNTATAADGVRVDAVVEGSPAELADLRVGDRIIGVGMSATPTFAQVSRELRRFRPGDEVTLLIQRGGQQLPLTAALTSPR